MSVKERLKKHELLMDAAMCTRGCCRATSRHVRQARMRMQRREIVRQYLRNTLVRKLQLGTGQNLLGGWLNTDYEPKLAEVAFLDARKEFPLPDGCLDFIFTEHMIEHVSHDSALFMLAECFRTLRPGGIVRVATPNLRNFVDLFGESSSPEARCYTEWALELNRLPRYPSAACFVLNNMLRRWGHQFVYDPVTLDSTLRRAGFSDIKLCTVGESSHAELRNIESHGKRIGEDANRFETMVMEGIRSSASSAEGTLIGQVSEIASYSQH